MFKFNSSKYEIKFLLLALVIAVGGTIGCSAGGAGGKGPSPARPANVHREASMESFDSVPVHEEAAELQDASVAGDESAFWRVAGTQNGRVMSNRDPFGLMPSEWPVDVSLHPQCIVAHSEKFLSDGHLIVTFISPDLATIPGVQTFHVDSLSTWENLEVNEEVPEDGSTARLIIIAERDDAVLRIVSEQVSIDTLGINGNRDYWREIVGSTPLVIRLFYTPLPPDD